jgi:hypothetical protein
MYYSDSMRKPVYSYINLKVVESVYIPYGYAVQRVRITCIGTGRARRYTCYSFCFRRKPLPTPPTLLFVTAVQSKNFIWVR